MAKDPICGMFVEENESSIHHTKDGISYYFCSSQCLEGPQKIKNTCPNKHSINHPNRIV